MQIAFDLKKACFGLEEFRIGVIHKKVGLGSPGQTFGVLKEKEEKQYGECLTRRLILEV